MSYGFPAEKLADLIDQAMNGDDEIDPHYLLEAIEKDLRNHTTRHTQELIDNPIS